MHAITLFVLFSVTVACVVATSPLSARPWIQGGLHMQHAKRSGQEDQCYKWACEGGSGKCGVLSDNTLTACLDNRRYCDLAPNSLVGTCAKDKENGATCSGGDECIGHSCSNGVCKESDVYRPNGKSCTANSQCDSEKCASGVCQALSNGDPCESDDQCSATDYCPSGISSVCTARGNTGQACSRHSCLGNLLCGASGVCVAPYTTPSGHACADSSECDEGTGCASYNGTSTCTTIPASSYADCTSDSDCTRMGEECQCNMRTGAQQCMQTQVNTPQGTASAIKDFDTCMIDQCKGNTDSYSCVLGVCKKQACHYQRVLFNRLLSENPESFSKCYLDYVLSSLACGSASTVTFSVGAMMVAVLAYLL